MKREMRWYDHIAISFYWLGINVATGTITPVLLPYLVIFALCGALFLESVAALSQVKASSSAPSTTRTT
jgi:hypothetical protein